MKKILFLLSIPALFAACIVDSPGKDPSREVEIRLSTSGGMQTRADDATDETIRTVDILVFDNSLTPDIHEDATFLYTRYAWPKSNGNIYNAVLKVGDDLDIYFAINAKQLIADAALTFTETTTWEDVHEALLLENPDQIDRAANGLPMWGYRHNVDVHEAPGNSFGTVRLLRAVASADIEIDLVSTSAGFTLEAGHVVYGSTKGYFTFTVDEGNMDFGEATGVDIGHPQADFKLIAPEIPTDATTTTDWRYEVPFESTTPNKIKDIFYFYENEGPDPDDPTDETHYTKLILEGRWHDPDKVSPDSYVTSYYPIALRDKAIVDGSNPRVPVIRNRKFNITITKVNGNGYPSLDEAKKGEDLNIVYDVIPWDNWTDSDIFVDGSKKISLSRSRNEGLERVAWLYRNAKSTDVISYNTNISPDQLALAMIPNGEAVTLTDEEKAAGIVAKIENAFYRVELIKDSTAGGEIQGRFLFTALQDYNPALPSISVLTVTFGRINFEITIGQRNSAPEDWNDGDKKDTILGYAQ